VSLLNLTSRSETDEGVVSEKHFCLNWFQRPSAQGPVYLIHGPPVHHISVIVYDLFYHNLKTPHSKMHEPGLCIYLFIPMFKVQKLIFKAVIGSVSI